MTNTPINHNPCVGGYYNPSLGRRSFSRLKPCVGGLELRKKDAAKKKIFRVQS